MVRFPAQHQYGKKDIINHPFHFNQPWRPSTNKAPLTLARLWVGGVHMRNKNHSFGKPFERMNMRLIRAATKDNEN